MNTCRNESLTSMRLTADTIMQRFGNPATLLILKEHELTGVLPRHGYGMTQFLQVAVHTEGNHPGNQQDGTQLNIP